jgi:metal-sulfur cluster biosynthetic enzyme
VSEGGSARIEAVRAALATVTDPELDQSVVELGFVTGLRANARGGVFIGFRLPTYWCATNFVFMMAEDLRNAALALPWVTAVTLRLDDHMYGDAINAGISEGKSFGESFPDEADAGLDELRRIFLLKSFQRRQEALLRHLAARGLAAEALASMPLDALSALALDDDGAALRARYLQRRALVPPMAPAFVTTEGAPIPVAGFTAYLRRLGAVGLNAEFNGALCRGLLAARYGEAPGELPAEPGLTDFIRALPAEQRN